MKSFSSLLLFLLSVLFLQSCDREMISSGYPNVITLSAEDNGEKVKFAGEIINEEKIKVDEVGFIWQNTDDPFAEPGFQVRVPDVSSGNFSTEIAWSLTNNKNYVLRAYAKCGDKTVYGDSLIFSTSLNVPCKLFKIEPDSAFRGDTIRFIGQGFNQTLSNNKVFIGGKNTRIIAANDSVLVCIVPNELTKGSKLVNILVNDIAGSFEQRFKLLLPPRAVVLTKDAYNVKWSTVNLSGRVITNELPCTVTFEYGISDDYGQSINAVPYLVGGNVSMDVTAILRDLTQNTVYHYRIRAESESGVSFGEDKSFCTLAAPPDPLITSLSTTIVKYGSTLKINGINLTSISGIVIGNTSLSIPVTPKTHTSELIEIEIYNQNNNYQLLPFTSFKVGLVYSGGTIWSESSISIQSSWRKMADLPSNARYKAGCFSLGGYIYVGGGADNGTALKDLWRFDPIINNWTRMSDIPGNPRVYPMGSANGSYGYLGGGFSADNSSKYQFYDFYKYDPQANVWTSIPNFPDPINNFFFNYSVSINNRPFFGLSNAIANNREIVNDTWISHPSVPDLMDSPANGVFTIGNSIYIICGYRTNGTINKSVWEFNTINETWTRKKDFPGSPRHSSVFFSIDKFGYYGCGRSFDAEQYKDMWRYDPENDSWIRLEDFPVGVRSHTISSTVGKRGYMGFGVLLSPTVYYKDFWQFNPE